MARCFNTAGPCRPELHYIPAGGQRQALELKVWRKGKPEPLAEGLAQLDSYLQRLGLDEGVLVIFDRRRKSRQAEPRHRFEQAATPSGRKVTVLRV